MSTPFIAEIKLISWNYPPKGWAFCNGQLLPINQNQALFSILGTTYGGDGRVNFALPNLQGRFARDAGFAHVLGETGGEYAHTLNASEMATHTHALQGSSHNASQVSPAAGVPADVRNTTGIDQYRHAPDSAMGAAIDSVGGSQPHENTQPYLVLNFVIALQGIFPSRN